MISSYRLYNEESWSIDKQYDILLMMKQIAKKCFFALIIYVETFISWYYYIYTFIQINLRDGDLNSLPKILELHHVKELLYILLS